MATKKTLILILFFLIGCSGVRVERFSADRVDISERSAWTEKSDVIKEAERICGTYGKKPKEILSDCVSGLDVAGCARRYQFACN